MNRTIDTDNKDNGKLDHLFSPVQTKRNTITNINDDDADSDSTNKIRDPNFLKCENIVSTPSLRQRMKMKEIIANGFRLVEEIDVQRLLKALHSLMMPELISGEDGPFRFPPIFTEFQRISPYWKILFGFSKEDPFLDLNRYAIVGENERNRSSKRDIVPSIKEAKLRGRWNGGTLSLEFLVFFLETRSFAAKQMIRKRMMFSEVDLSFGTYPWAQVGMEIIRLVGVLFEFIHIYPSTFVDPITNAATNYDHDGPNLRPTKAGAFSYQSWWGRILEKNWFERLFVCTFLIFDCLFEQYEKAHPSLASSDSITNSSKRSSFHNEMWDSINLTLRQSRLVLMDLLEKTTSIDDIEACVGRYITELKLKG